MPSSSTTAPSAPITPSGVAPSRHRQGRKKARPSSKPFKVSPHCWIRQGQGHEGSITLGYGAPSTTGERRRHDGMAVSDPGGGPGVLILTPKENSSGS